jgi:hypothetical protein
VKQRARALGLLTLVVVSLNTGCVTFRTPGFATPAPERNWPNALAAAKSEALEGRFGEADGVLAAFAKNYAGSAEALETSYWRAIFKMDPANPDASLPAALASLDAYLTDHRPRQHVTEAAAMRRAAGQLDAANKLAASALEQAKDANSTAASARAQAADASARAEAKSDGAQSADNEIKRLKDELARANAELERIRKRLAAPPTKPPA